MSAPTVWIAVRDLSLSGVPVMLDRLLEATPAAARAGVHVIARHGGPLLDHLDRSAGTVTVLEPDLGRSLTGAGVAALRSGGAPAGGDILERIAWRFALRHLPTPDVLVVHGAGAWPIRAAVTRDVPVVLHVHELDTALDRCIPVSDRAAAFAGSLRVMVVSGPVADLARRWGTSRDAVVTVPGVADPTPARDRAGARARLGAGLTWVLGCGRPGWRKGTDRLAPIAHELRRRGRSVEVGWVGGRPAGGDAEWEGSRDPVVWFPEQQDPWSVLAGASAIVVPSREDPLPLVALEAGRHGLPVVAMPTGGLPDLLGSGRGLVAGSHDVAELCELIDRVITSPDLAATLGNALSSHVERHHHVDVVAPMWWEVITDVAAGRL